MILNTFSCASAYNARVSVCGAIRMFIHETSVEDEENESGVKTDGATMDTEWARRR